MIPLLTRNALKGQQQLAQGSALGIVACEKDALKVQKNKYKSFCFKAIEGCSSA